MNTLSLFFVVVCCLVSVSTAVKYKSQTFTLPAYQTPGNGGVSSRGEQTPLPHFNHKIGIKYWGDWEVIDAETDKPLPLGKVFFHHITVFRTHTNGKDREFLTGCSDDRRTLGPELPEGYLQLVDSSPTDENIQGYYHIVNLMPHAIKMAVRYRVVYVADDEIPAHTSFVKAYFMSTAYNVPGNGGVGSTHTQITETTAPATGRVITAVGHLHQGAFNVSLVDRKTQRVLVSSRAIYADSSENDHCFYAEWCAQSGKPWTKNRVKDLELVNLEERQPNPLFITRNTKWQMISYYDNGAEYRTVMAWVVLFVDESASA